MFKPNPRTVHKHQIPAGSGTTVLRLPEGATFLHAGFQREGVSVVHAWFEVDSTKPTFERRFQVFGTGHMIPALAGMCQLEYVGTAQDQSMSLVWHIYEER